MIDTIIKRRKERGFGQIGMARKLYMHPNTYRKIEQGKRELTVSEFVVACVTLGLDPRELIQEVDV